MELYRVQQWRPKLVLQLLLLLLQVWGSTCANLFDLSARVAPLNGLMLHYYKYNTSCTHAEEFVQLMVNSAWKADRSVTAALLRLLYSDCLVTGCDASILLDGDNTEKYAIQNQGLRTNGLYLIDDIKKVLEARCPGVVSCADILNLAAKEAVALSNTGYLLNQIQLLNDSQYNVATIIKEDQSHVQTPKWRNYYVQKPDVECSPDTNQNVPHQRYRAILSRDNESEVRWRILIDLQTAFDLRKAGAPKYPVYTGRRDGLQSTAQSVDLPPPDVTWKQALAYFESKGLDVLDLGTLLAPKRESPTDEENQYVETGLLDLQNLPETKSSHAGAHSVGMTHCSNIQDRLYNFNGTGRPDSSMDPNFLAQLKKKCPPGSKENKKVYLNPASGRNYSFESSYYKRVLKHQAVFTEDQQMITTSDGIRIAHEFAAGFEDLRKFFALSMTRMGGLGVLTGKQGEIRRSCRYTNANNPHLK
ncbi:probable peroxidase 26 [Dendrobium catenatum]|uniref:probable peroxidase 26 n=1 Tax=Dendrobium catenatum TaxID=906689 RepID=UPI00109EE46C|nr:probable peroxidase 26 [Dendrobium catenatum]